MAHTISPIDRDPRLYTITESLDNEGNTVVLAEIQVAMLPANVEPSTETVWVTLPVTDNRFEAVLTGYGQTAQDGDLVVGPRGGDVYIKPVDVEYTKAVPVERINVQR